MVAQSRTPAPADPTAVPVATMTLARTAGEQTLLERALKRLADGRRLVAVADGGSGGAFVEAIAALPRTTIVPPEGRPGLVAQVKGSLRAAVETGARAILYTEPDKEGFFAGGLDPFLRAAAAIDG